MDDGRYNVKLTMLKAVWFYENCFSFFWFCFTTVLINPFYARTLHEDDSGSDMFNEKKREKNICWKNYVMAMGMNSLMDIALRL